MSSPSSPFRVRFVWCALLLSLAVTAAACAAEDGPDAPAGPAVTRCGTAAVATYCEAGDRCISFAALPACVQDCTTTASCGIGRCCTKRGTDNDGPGLYCVLLSDPLGRGGDMCLP